MSDKKYIGFGPCPTHGETMFVETCDACLVALEAEIARLRDALSEISRGEGPFSRDPLEHAENCIESMKALALAACKACQGKEPPQADGER